MRLKAASLAFAFALFAAVDLPAAQDFVPGQVIVKLRPGRAKASLQSQSTRVRSFSAGRATSRARKFTDAMERFAVLDLPAGVTVEQAIASLRSNPDVEYVGPNYRSRALIVPNDTLFGAQWGMNNTGQDVEGVAGTPDADIDAPEAWDIETGATSEVIVAVIDSGIALAHPDLSGSLWTNPSEVPGNGLDDDGNGIADDVHGANFVRASGNPPTGSPADDNGHGSHVAGIIAATTNNGGGVAGVSWNARIMALKFLDSEGLGDNAHAIEAIQYAVANGAHVINNSWGGVIPDPALAAAVQAAKAAGVVLTAAAGNSNNASNLEYPAAYPDVIAVSATNNLDDNVNWNYGSHIDVGAPGYNILSTIPGPNTALVSGTSMAAPHVAGVAALLKSRNPSLSPDQIETILEKSAEIPNGWDSRYGVGRINAQHALRSMDDVTPPTVAISSPVNGATVSGLITIDADASDDVAVTKVEFLVDGAVRAFDSTAPYSIMLNSALVPDGTYTVTARAFDVTGAQTDASVTLVVANTDPVPPSVSIVSPVAGSTLTGTVPVTATASDNVGVTAVWFYVNQVFISSDTSSPYNATLNTILAADGNYTLTALARDAAINQSTMTIPISIRNADTTFPTVEISSPLDGATLSGDVAISATASDNVGVTAVGFFIDGVFVSSDTESPYAGALNTALYANGAHVLSVRARDAANNTSSTTINVSIANGDLVFPAVSITAPVDGTEVGGIVNVTATASDNVGVEVVGFFVNGVFASSDTIAPYAAAFDSMSVADGSHTITAAARDAANNVSSATISVNVKNVDGIPPTVSITSPADGAVVSGTVGVAATASDNIAVEGVGFFIDGVMVSSDTTSPYAATLDSLSIADGPHAVMAVARDASSNVSSVTISVNVSNTDTVFPAVSLISPAEGATVSGAVALAADASDNIGVTAVGFFIDGVFLSSDTAAPYGASFDSLVVADGSRTITAAARDAANNVSSATITVTVANADLISPTVAITAPAEGATISGTVNVTADAFDNVGVTGVGFFVDGVLASSDTTSPYAATLDSLLIADGAHSLMAAARDASNNVSSATITVNVANADTAPPTVSITAPADGATVTGTVAIEAFATDNIGVAAVGFFIDGVFASSDTAVPYTASFDSLLVADASHTIAAAARDAANNVSTAAISILVRNADVVPPVVSITAPADGATVSGPIGVSANASDDVGVITVGFFIDGVFASSDTVSPYGASFDSLLIADGSHTITAAARDAANNVSSATVSVVVANADTVPPSVSITAPADGATLSGTVQITAKAADNVGVAGVGFFLNGVLLSSGATSPYAASFDSAALPDGSYAITAAAADASNNVSSATITVTFSNADGVAPSVSITSPADGASLTGIAPIEASASDNVAVAGVAFFLNNVLISSDTTSPYAAALDTAHIPNGTYDLRAVAADTSNNFSTAAISVTIGNADLTPPTVAITAPADGANLSGTVQIEATATDDVAVAAVGFFIGQVLISSDTTSPYSASLNTGALSNGTYQIRALAQDTSNNLSTATIAVTVGNVDQAPPSLQITAPADGTTVNGTIQISADASDDVAIAGVGFFIGAVFISSDTASPYAAALNTLSVANGEHTIRAVARDTSNNVSTAAINVTVSNSGSGAPTVTITSPADGSTVSGTISIEATASSPAGIQGVAFFANGVAVATDTTAPYTATLNTAGVPNGAYTIAARAVDGANQIASDSIGVTVNNTSDNEPPSVSFAWPLENGVISGAVSIEADASDNVGVVGVQFMLDGVVFDTDTMAPYASALNTTALPNGAKTLTLRAFDAAGNNASDEIAVNVQNGGDSTPPAVSITAPADGATVAGTVTVLADASDNRSVNAVEFRVDGVVIGVDAAPPYSATFNANLAPEGTRTITVRAVDGELNAATDSIQVIAVHLPGDSTPPAVSVDSPANGQGVSGIVDIAASASDNNLVSHVEFFMDGVRLGRDFAAPYAFEWDSAEAASGSHTLMVRAVDAHGNVSEATVALIVGGGPAQALGAFHGLFNPVRGEVVTIPLTLVQTTHVKARILDRYGVEIAVIADQDLPAGSSISWNGRNGSGEIVASGAYILIVDVGGSVQTRKVVVRK